MPGTQIPRFRLVPEPVDDAARNLVAGRLEAIDPVVGTRNQIGGEPLLLHQMEWPTCPTCDEAMSFYGQLDSLPDVRFALADAGLIFVFVCLGCFETTALLQSA